MERGLLGSAALPLHSAAIFIKAAWQAGRLHPKRWVACAGAELTRIPYGGNFTAGDGGGEAAADARRALASNAGLRKQRTARVRSSTALEAVRRSFLAARSAVRRVRGVRSPGESAGPST